MAAPTKTGSNQTSGNGITSLAISGLGLAVGDLCSVVVLSTSYTAAAPTITNGTNSWDLDLDVQASGANQRAIFYSRVMTSNDFFPTPPAALAISGWSASGTIRVLASGYHHANGFASTAALRKYANPKYDTAAGGSGDYTVATLSDCPNACVLITAIGGGATGTLAIKYDGSGTANGNGTSGAPFWDENVLTTSNQADYRLYDAGAAGPTAVVYTANGNNNKAIGTVVYQANPDPKPLSGKGSLAFASKGTIYRQQPVTPVSGKASTVWGGTGRLKNPNVEKHSPGKGSIAWVGGGRMALIKRPLTKTATVFAGKAAGLIARRQPRSKSTVVFAGRGSLVRQSVLTEGRIQFHGMTVTAIPGDVTVEPDLGRIRFAGMPADAVLSGQAVALPGFVHLFPSAADPVVAGVLRRSGYRNPSASSTSGLAPHETVAAYYSGSSASSGRASTNRFHRATDSYRSTSASGTRGMLPAPLRTVSRYRSLGASLARFVGRLIVPTTRPGFRYDTDEDYALDFVESYVLDVVDDQPQYGAP